MGYFRLELNRMMKSRKFMTAFIISMVIVLLDVGQDFYDYYQGMNHYSVFEKWMGVRYYTLGSTMWNFLFMLLVSIPFSCSLCSELKNHYGLHIITKIGKKKYYSTKVIISFISGFMISFVALVLDFMLLALYNRATYPEVDAMTVSISQYDFLSVMFYTHPYVYCFAWLGVICIWAGIFSVFTLTIGLFIKKTSFTLVVAQILFILQAILSDFFPYMINGRQVELSWMGLLYGDSLLLNPWFAIFGSQTVLLLICILVIWWKGKRYSYV